ncbi:uncharacterized protein [Chironomus tepperi]|uniref:uncharacterized protein n=1 Tax=Chironomus tepperi TaxID=113505 RepID=UPI00391F8612
MLNNLEIKFDIIVLGETKLLGKRDYNIENYKPHFCWRNSKNSGGGLLVYIHNHIKIDKITIKSSSYEKIKIVLNSKKTTILCYYRQPKLVSYKPFMKDINEEMEKSQNHMIIVGDINLNKNDDSEKLNKYKLLLTCYNFHIMNNAVTRNVSGTIIDHLILNFKNKCNVRNYTVNVPQHSDHNMVISFISNVKSNSCNKITIKDNNNHQKQSNGIDNSDEQFIKSILHLKKQKNYDPDEEMAKKRDEIFGSFKDTSLSCRTIVLNYLNQIFNKYFKKLNNNNGASTKKYNKEIAACELWQTVQEHLDIKNNKICLISLNIKNNFNLQNIKNLFKQLLSKNIGGFDEKLKGTLFLYGKNYILMHSNVNLDRLIENIKYDMKIILKFLSMTDIKLNIEETNFILFGTTKKKITDVDMIEIENTEGEIIEIKKSNTIKYLDLIIDDNKSWKEHINFIAMKIASVVGYLKTQGKSLTEDEKEQIYVDRIEHHLKKHVTIWGFPQNPQYLENLQCIQNMALRTIYGIDGLLYDDMFTNNTSKQREIYQTNSEKFLPIRGLYIAKTISIISEMKLNFDLEPKEYRTLTSCKSLKCLGVIIYNNYSDIQNLNDENYINLFLNSKNFKTVMDNYVKPFQKKHKLMKNCITSI